MQPVPHCGHRNVGDVSDCTRKKKRTKYRHKHQSWPPWYFFPVHCSMYKPVPIPEQMRTRLPPKLKHGIHIWRYARALIKTDFPTKSQSFPQNNSTKCQSDLTHYSWPVLSCRGYGTYCWTHLCMATHVIAALLHWLAWKVAGREWCCQTKSAAWWGTLTTLLPGTS